MSSGGKPAMIRCRPARKRTLATGYYGSEPEHRGQSVSSPPRSGQSTDLHAQAGAWPVRTLFSWWRCNYHSRELRLPCWAMLRELLPDAIQLWPDGSGRYLWAMFDADIAPLLDAE